MERGRKKIYMDSLTDPTQTKKQRDFAKKKWDEAYDQLVDLERKVGIHKIAMQNFGDICKAFKHKSHKLWEIEV